MGGAASITELTHQGKLEVVRHEMVFFWGVAFEPASRWHPFDFVINNKKGKPIAVAGFQWVDEDDAEIVADEAKVKAIMHYASKMDVTPLWIWRSPKDILFAELTKNEVKKVGGTNLPDEMKKRC